MGDKKKKSRRFAAAQLQLSEKYLAYGRLAYGRLDGYELSHATAIAENNGSGDTGVEGVIGAAANVLTGLERCPALPNKDGATGDDLAGKPLDAKPLGV